MQRLLLDDTLRQRLSAHLAAFERIAAPGAGLKHAAVALALVPGQNDEVSFLLTRRVVDLNHHGGQFALPGGLLDQGESVAQAALRELDEELGVSLDEGSVLGVLDDFVTRSGFVMTPVVVWGPAVTRMSPNPGEVAIVYRVPVRALYAPEVPVISQAEDPERPLLSLPLLGTHIFSPTAAIIFQMREVAFEGLNTRVAHYDQPRFAWK